MTIYGVDSLTDTVGYSLGASAFHGTITNLSVSVCVVLWLYTAVLQVFYFCYDKISRVYFKFPEFSLSSPESTNSLRFPGFPDFPEL